MNLIPALKCLSTEVLQVTEVDRTEFAEFAPLKGRRTLRLGILPMGLADGLTYCNAGRVLVRGRSVPVLGPRLSLEHARVDLSDAPDAEAGDRVVVIGAQADEAITLDDVLAYQGPDVNPEAISVAIRSTVQRRYWRAGQVVESPIERVI
jgi:alanine racemase